MDIALKSIWDFITEINRKIEELSNSEFLVEGDREKFLRFYREVLRKYNKTEYL